jgi:hypothetical protein
MTTTPTDTVDANARNSTIEIAKHLSEIASSDIRERVLAAAADVELLAEQTQDLRARALALIEEANALEGPISEAATLTLEQYGSTEFDALDDLLNGLGRLVTIMTGADRLYLELHHLADLFHETAEGSPHRGDQEVAAE